MHMREREKEGAPRVPFVLLCHRDATKHDPKYPSLIPTFLTYKMKGL
jgi:hypothetical protein